MRKTSVQKKLAISCTKADLVKILAVGREFDVDKGGYYDARSGAVNFWCGPEDKPSCWDQEIIQGALNYPRDYVSGLYWDFNEGTGKFDLRIDVVPYALLEKKKALTDEVWDKLIEWTEHQVKGIIRLAAIHETDLGTCCPFCDFVLPVDYLLNDMLEHINEKHLDVKIKAVTVGGRPTLDTNKGRFVLKKKTDAS